MTQRPSWERPIQMFDPVAPSIAPPPGTPVTEYVPDPRERVQMFDPVEPMNPSEGLVALTREEIDLLKQLVGRVGPIAVQRVLNEIAK